MRVNLLIINKCVYILKKSNIKDTNFFTKKFTNCCCDTWLLINEKVILTVGLDKNQQKVDRINRL